MKRFLSLAVLLVGGVAALPAAGWAHHGSPGVIVDTVRPRPATQVRDHRSQPRSSDSASGGVTVHATPGGRGTAKTLPPFGITVRDHRSAKPAPVVRDHRVTTPIVRDHRTVKPAPIVRDHRKPKPAPIVRDHRTGSAPVVRDHRTPEAGPIVRDHRTPKAGPVVRDHR